MSSPKIRIAVVDDSQLLLRWVQKVLPPRGIDVCTRHSPLGVRPFLLQENPDLLLLDVNMPALNGAELCKMIKGHHATEKIRVVLHSTMPQSELEELVRTTGADGYIQKTDDPDTLIREVLRSMSSTTHP